MENGSITAPAGLDLVKLPIWRTIHYTDANGQPATFDLYVVWSEGESDKERLAQFRQAGFGVEIPKESHKALKKMAKTHMRMGERIQILDGEADCPFLKVLVVAHNSEGTYVYRDYTKSADGWYGRLRLLACRS